LAIGEDHSDEIQGSIRYIVQIKQLVGIPSPRYTLISAECILYASITESGDSIRILFPN